MKTSILLGLILALPAVASPPPAPLLALQKAGARVGALVVRLDDGKILAALNPDEMLPPASVSKLYVAALALARWGPQYRFISRLTSSAPIHGSTLEGNLVFRGGGNPALTDAWLWKLARNLHERGIHRVTGDLVVDESRFGRLGCTTRDRCRGEATSRHAYNARIGASVVDFGTAALVVMPAHRPGRTARLALEPFPLPDLAIQGRIETVAAGRPWQVVVTRRRKNGSDIFQVAGSVPASAPARRYYRAVADPLRFSGEVLRAFLVRAGVHVTGTVQIRFRPFPAGKTLARIKGQPLWILVRRMLTWSNNFMADTLALDLLRRRHSPPLTLAAAGALITRRARGLEALAPVMRDHRPTPALYSGSGLTTASRTSARDVVALLQTLYRRFGLLPTFLGTLTVPAHTPSSLLKFAPDSVWMRQIAVKTGSLNQPHSVFALAGYLRFATGGWGAFAVLINGTAHYQVPLATAIAATREAITPFLRPRARTPRAAGRARVHSAGPGPPHGHKPAAAPATDLP